MQFVLQQQIHQWLKDSLSNGLNGKQPKMPVLRLVELDNLKKLQKQF